MSSRQTGIALRLLLGGLLFTVVLLPVVGFYAAAIGSEGPGATSRALPSLQAVLRSLALASTAAAVALLLGLPVALGIARLDSPWARVLPFLALIPLAIPPTIQAYAWMIFPGGAVETAAFVRSLIGATPGGGALGASPWGCGLILGVCLWPIVAFLGAAGLLAGSGLLEQAAAPYAGEGWTLWRITLPGLWPSAAVGAGIVFWMALSNFPVPSLLAMETLSTKVFESVSVGSRPAEAAVGSLCLLVAAIPPLVVLGLILRRRPPLSLGVPSPGRPLRRYRHGVLLPGGIALVLGAVFPIVSLLRQAEDLAAFRRAIAIGGEPLAHSALVAASAATVSTALGFLAAAALPRAGWSRRLTWAVGLLAFVLPGYLLGQGLIYIYNRPGPLRFVYERWPVLALGLGAAFFLPAFAALSAAKAGIPPSLEESAAAAGAGPLRRLVRIHLPLLLRDAAAVWLVIFTLTFGEAGAAILREPPGFQTAQVLLFNQMHYGRDQDVAALCLLGVAISLVPLLVAAFLWRRRPVVFAS